MLDARETTGRTPILALYSPSVELHISYEHTYPYAQCNPKSAMPQVYHLCNFLVRKIVRQSLTVSLLMPLLLSIFFQ